MALRGSVLVARLVCKSHHVTIRLVSSVSNTADFHRAVTDAERIVGYSTSFLSLRCLLSDELSNVAMQMRKLVGTNHPLLKTARTMFYSGKQTLQTRGLLVLLIAKVAGPSSARQNHNVDEVMTSGIYPRQRTLAEITEMIHTAALIHRGVVNLSSLSDAGGDGLNDATVGNKTAVLPDAGLNDMAFGNKMAVLSGDFLLANASTGLASLHNTEVVEKMSEAIGDFVKAEFSPLNGLDSWERLTAADAADSTPACDWLGEWEQLTYLTNGSLIANSCSAAVCLAGHSQQLQQLAYEFGKNISFANQINEELQCVQLGQVDHSNTNNGVHTRLLPVLVHMQSNARTGIKIKSFTDVEKLLQRVSKDEETLLQMRRLRAKYTEKAALSLVGFGRSPALSALNNIIAAINRL